jgi:hypothetical protein
MTSIILAWLVGEGLMIYNDVTKQKRPPLPADLLSTSGLFVLLALLGESQPKLAATLAWGFDAAAFLVLWENNPTALSGQTKTAAPKAAPKAKAK